MASLARGQCAHVKKKTRFQIAQDKVTGGQFHPTMPSIEKVRIHRAERVDAGGGQSATASPEETFSHTVSPHRQQVRPPDAGFGTNKVPEVFTNVLFQCYHTGQQC